MDSNSMVLIPSGVFLMGIDELDIYVEKGQEKYGDVYKHSHPMQEIYLDAFYISKFCVTNAEYRQFVLETDYRAPFVCNWSPMFGLAVDGWNPIDKVYPKGHDELPVVNVSWYDALAYCDWAGFRLPTEAEWEKVARGVDGRRFPWGNEYKEDYYSHTSPFNYETRKPNPKYSRFPPKVNSLKEGISPYGCYQMFGSIDEWCADWWNPDFYKWMPKTNPVAPKEIFVYEGRYDDQVRKVAYKVLRGSDIYMHIGYREYQMPWDACGTGFRCALSIEKS